VSPTPHGGPELLPVFVYGTLRPAQVNWPHLAPWAVRTEPARLPGHRLYALEYPCAVAADAATGRAIPAVLGDLVWLREDRYAEALEALDEFEGVHADATRSLYVRARLTVVTPTAPPRLAWAYLAGTVLRARLRPELELRSGEWSG
jgi:gamma-glutamylcyclotransferase (GGCT)/AIG2-like uncharacterized protein YtfP